MTNQWFAVPSESRFSNEKNQSQSLSVCYQTFSENLETIYGSNEKYTKSGLDHPGIFLAAKDTLGLVRRAVPGPQLKNASINPRLCKYRPRC